MLMLCLNKASKAQVGCLYQYDTWQSHSKYDEYVEAKVTMLYILSNKDWQRCQGHSDSINSILDKYQPQTIYWLYDYDKKAYCKPNELFRLDSDRNTYDFVYPYTEYWISRNEMESIQLKPLIERATKIYRSTPSIQVVYKNRAGIIGVINFKGQNISMDADLLEQAKNVEITVRNAYGDEISSSFKLTL